MFKKILAIFLVITGLYIVISSLPILNWIGLGNGALEAAVSERTDEISINTSSVHTIIIPDKRSDVKAEYDGKGKVEVDQKGDKIVVTAKGPRFGFFSFKQRGDLKLYIPEDYDQDMNIKVGSGSLEFAGDSAKDPYQLNNLSLNVGSGRMEVQNIKANHVEHDISSGFMKVNSLSAKSGSFEVSSGSLHAEDYTGAFEAEVSSGELNLEVKKLTGPAEIEVSSGKADLNLPDDADFTLNSKVSSGSVNNDFQLTDKSSGKNRLSGTHGSGTHKINLDVSSGNIYLH
ncbi:DUF4097 family beta strand repeat-containing protein [Mesobacillus foraminis]|uniref:LiaG family protein n=1 Tax=Mesobacillus foraminis TaxID=279826 RepID=UPI0039A0A745